MMRIVGVGHSHLTALQRAWQSEENRYNFEFEKLVLARALASRYATVPSILAKDVRAFSPPVLELLAERQNDNTAFISLTGGNACNIFGLIEHSTPFDFIDPEEPDIPVENENSTVPYRHIAQLLNEMMNPHLNELIALRAFVKGRLAHFESPPPIRSNDYIRKNLDEFFRKVDTDRAISGSYLRLKLWRMQSRIYSRLCTQINVDFVRAPISAQDGEGFLLPEYYSNNATHANSSYGALVLDLVAKYFEEVG